MIHIAVVDVLVNKKKKTHYLEQSSLYLTWLFIHAHDTKDKVLNVVNHQAMTVHWRHCFFFSFPGTDCQTVSVLWPSAAHRKNSKAPLSLLIPSVGFGSGITSSQTDLKSASANKTVSLPTLLLTSAFLHRPLFLTLQKKKTLEEGLHTACYSHDTCIYE